MVVTECPADCSLPCHLNNLITFLINPKLACPPSGYSTAFARVGLLVVLNLAYYLKPKSAQANERDQFLLPRPHRSLHLHFTKGWEDQMAWGDILVLGFFKTLPSVWRWKEIIYRVVENHFLLSLSCFFIIIIFSIPVQLLELLISVLQTLVSNLK